MKPTFIQFANAFFKIIHHRWGLIPYQSLRHHIELSELFENNHVICKKYRQGGFSTFIALWSLWKAMTNEGWHGLLISNYDRESLYLSRILKTAYDNLPADIKPEAKKHNDHTLTLENDSTIHCLSHSNLIGKGTRQDAIIFDECAFYRNNDFENHYKAVWPMISMGGRMYLVSTPNGQQGHFYKTYKDAVLNKNQYYAYAPSIFENPEMPLDRMGVYSENLGRKGFLMEAMGEFLELQ